MLIFRSIFAVFNYVVMFIKKVDKNNKKTGVSYYTYRLCETYRIEDKVRHRNILNVGKLHNIRKEDFKLLRNRIEQKIKDVNVNTLFLNVPENVEKEAEYIYRRILHEKLLDCTTASASPIVASEPEPESEKTDIQKVDINSISNEDSRTFGGEWLAKQMIDDCGLTGYLSQSIGNEDTEKLISAEIISRMVHPSSELETSRWMANDSSLCEILSLPQVPSHRKLYKAARELYEHKDKVEDFLYQHFASKYPDRKKRNDAKLVSLVYRS